MKKVVTVVLCPIILIAFSSVCYFFFIGDPIDGRQIECSIRREENTAWAILISALKALSQTRVSFILKS